uniref:Uncharacterized protein n=1 Tax=Ditylenchus dipsaci TaxID=166011 RepID=A0A915D7Z6_9BILA
MIKNYNSTKFGVDIFDEMLKNYSYSPSVKRWPLRFSCRSLLVVLRSTLMSYMGHSQLGENSPICLRSSIWKACTIYGIIWKLMEGLYNGLRSKILGDEKNPPLWCYICNKVERGSKLNECGKCQKT